MNLRGVIPPLVTPLTENGDVCKKCVIRLISCVTSFSSALMPCLSSGEGWALSDKQWKDMLNYTISNAGNLPVLVGIELPLTSQVIKRAKIARKLGASAIVITTPFGKCSQEEIYLHFKQIAKAVNLPAFLYNEKAISGNAIELETIIKICNLGNIIGIKEASGNARFTNELMRQLPLIPIFQGWENLLFETNTCNGNIVPLANLEPKICREMAIYPTLEKQKNINKLCKKYNLLSSNWYLFLKRELKRRCIICTGALARNDYKNNAGKLLQ